MKYGIGFLSVIPMRAEPSDKSELINQILFGEGFEVLESHNQWLQVSLKHDQYIGWIDKKQILIVEDAYFEKLQSQKPHYSGHVMDMLADEQGRFLGFILLGSVLPDYRDGTFRYENKRLPFEGEVVCPEKNREGIIRAAYDYLNAPYLWGGRTPIGIDCSGLTQMAYRFGGISLLRDASQQATQGHALSFIEEALPGDLAFFDNEEGRITHVGLVLPDNHILHASGQVRIDRFDQTGIYNNDLRRHTHKLRLMKTLF
jgi:hypothetical protein